MSIKFQFYGPGLDPGETLCVDGRVFGLRCLSHWPGPPPPPVLTHDVTTGMALTYANLTASKRAALLGTFGIVTNDHYDTDGALAMFTLMHPDVARQYSDLLVRAARTGDFRTWEGEDALAVDLTVWGVLTAPNSPLCDALAKLDGDAAFERCYHWILANLPEILVNPFRWESLWRPRFDRVLTERQVLLAGNIRVDRFDELDLAVIYTDEPITRHTIVAAAGDLFRVLIVHECRQGFRYRFFYRNESWFLGRRETRQPRCSLEPAVSRLQQIEQRTTGRWWCTPIEGTAAQMGFGLVGRQAGVFDDFRVERDPESSLAPSQVINILSSTLRSERKSS